VLDALSLEEEQKRFWMPTPLVIFVPGIMGSVLRYTGPGRGGDLVEQDVWGTDPGVIIDTLARWPNRLRSPNLRATEVLSRIKGRVWGKLVDMTFYGPLLEFCVEKAEKGGLGLDRDTEFVAFAYDWRLDNRETAKRLALRIEQADPQHNRAIGLIAHSMGGLVSRLMLLDQPIISSRTRFFVQIASPILGAAKAFYSLREGPCFSPQADFLVRLKQLKDQQVRADLMSVLREFPSMYQLLPPDDVPVLFTSTGKLLPAMAAEAWPGNDQVHLEAARDMHKALEKPLPVPINCVYANDHETPWCYKVDTEFRVVASFKAEVGDGTVTSASAFEGSEVADRCRLTGENTAHDELPCNPEVEKILRPLVEGLRAQG